MENNDIYKLCEEFGVKGEIVGVSILTSGHINSTFKVDVDNSGKRKTYIIQKVNDYVFKKPEAPEGIPVPKRQIQPLRQLHPLKDPAFERKIIFYGLEQAENPLRLGAYAPAQAVHVGLALLVEAHAEACQAGLDIEVEAQIRPIGIGGAAQP